VCKQRENRQTCHIISSNAKTLDPTAEPVTYICNCVLTIAQHRFILINFLLFSAAVQFCRGRYTNTSLWLWLWLWLWSAAASASRSRRLEPIKSTAVELKASRHNYVGRPNKEKFVSLCTIVSSTPERPYTGSLTWVCGPSRPMWGHI